MKRYGNRSGHSGVAFFDDGPDFIKVQFGETDTVVYVYDHVIPGAADVARMKALAVAGRGLSSYISQHVRDRYRRKENRSVTD
ncbi:MAG TPA: hypothetical protein VN706_11060 [Gemmatimonadaceae bacterium]|nr:hypothetical protein [Gemmatimonadaceae bacterium]